MQSWVNNTTGVFVVEWNNGQAGADEKEFLAYCPAVRVAGEPHVVDGPGVTMATIRLIAEDADIAASDATIGGINGTGQPTATHAPIMFRVSNAVDPATFIA